jgi:anti-sigma regulatory factor (Ser/Thr protein kinase)
MRPHQTVPPQSVPGVPRGATWLRLVGPFEVTLAAGLDAPAAARAAVTHWMAGHVSRAMLVDAQLLVSELVANSVRHSDSAADAVVSVRAHVRADVLVLEVHDRETGGSITRRAPDPQLGGGFGLNVVEALSRRWGVTRDAGTRVWVELAFSATG